MATHLHYAFYPLKADIRVLESDLIRHLEPPLNLTKWQNPKKKEIQALRNLCKQEARRFSGS